MIIDYLQVMSNMLCGVNFIAGYEALMVAKKVFLHTNYSHKRFKCSKNLFFGDKNLTRQDLFGRGNASGGGGGGVIHRRAQAIHICRLCT